MLITKTSIISGKSHSREIDIDPMRLAAWEATWENDPNDPHIQDAFPDLHSYECEFILTGITPDEWNAMFDDEISFSL